MVAKSYQTLEIIGEPYNVSGRPYVKVRTKTGALKQVRWYSDAEYYKMYPEEKLKKVLKPQKEVLGFTLGYITIFKGNTYEDKEYFKNNSARYNKYWGWYFISTDPIPNDIPEDVSPIQLDWDLVGNENGTLKSEAEVIAAVESLIYDPDESEYQGEVGDKLELYVTVENAVPLEGIYGASTMHIMRDDAGNCYVWTTAAKSWEKGSTHHITGSIKGRKLYRGVKQTILTRCRTLR